MLKLRFHPFLMLRTPAFGMVKYEQFRQCLDDSMFRAALKLASSSLYAELEKRAFEFDALDSRLKTAVRKYFNRMCYRPTPFGMFAAFSPLFWKENGEGRPTVPAVGDLFLQSDFIKTVTAINELSVNVDETIYYPNNSIYRVGRCFRFLIRKPNGTFGSEHGIQSVGADGFLKDLLIYCAGGKRGQEIKDYLLEYFDDSTAAEGYLAQLIEAQLLTSELVVNIVGESYFERIKRKSPESFIAAPQEILAKTKVAVGKEISPSLDDQVYSVYRRPITGGGLDKRFQGTLLKGLQCLNKLTQVEQPALLCNFKKSFRSKFDDREIPLLVALDPELGVGYGSMEQIAVKDLLCSDINTVKKYEPEALSWSQIQKLLINKWTANFTRKPTDPIEITNEDLGSVPEELVNIPPGFNVVFRVVETGKVIIEQAGGISGTALHGRFTPFDELSLKEVKKIAQIEQANNRGVAFAEIGYFNNEHAANINIRDHLYDYEIPILTHSTLPTRNQIPLNDLEVSVVNDEIVLRSRRLNKVIIPRLSSAYNHNRSELTVFRFLCDLQHQGLKSNFSLDIKRLFPDLSFYPRIEHESCILSPASWVLDKVTINAASESPESFVRIADKLQLPRRISLTSNDNHLVFDLASRDEVEFLLQCIRKSSRVELNEFMAPADTTDESGNIYVNQFIATMFAEEQVYRLESEVHYPEAEKRVKVKRAFTPGEEWLYLKIYCHESVADEVLLRYVEPVVARLRQEGIIYERFFVRFRDPEPHLRIRLKRHSRTGGMDVLERFNKKLHPLIVSGRVSSMQTDTYKRELERYGSEIIELAESSFSASSDIVVNQLRKSATFFAEKERIIYALQAADLILSSFYEHNGRIRILKDIHQIMSSEFEGRDGLKVNLDRKYREHRSLIEQGLAGSSLQKAGLDEFRRVLVELKRRTAKWPLERQARLISDLLHMHMNRLFTSDQRKHEFVIYYLLEKYYSTSIRRFIYGTTESGLRQYA